MLMALGILLNTAAIAFNTILFLYVWDSAFKLDNACIYNRSYKSPNITHDDAFYYLMRMDVRTHRGVVLGLFLTAQSAILGWLGYIYYMSFKPLSSLTQVSQFTCILYLCFISVVTLAIWVWTQHAIRNNKDLDTVCPLYWTSGH